MKKQPGRIIKIAGGALASAFLSFFALPVLAAAPLNAGLQPIANVIELGTTDIRTIIGRIIYVALGIMGTVLLVIIIYAGFLWMTAGGNEERVATAKKWLINGVIGLAIILASYAITYFIITRLVAATTGVGGPENEQAITTSFGDFGTASLGEGIIQSVYPSPGATGIARNSKIVVTFKLPIDPTTIIANGAMKDRGDGEESIYTGTINLANVRLVPTADLATGGAFETSSNQLVSAVNAYSVDNQTFVFAPVQYLGNPNTNVSYTVALGPGIMLADGKTPAFTGDFSMGYHWEFETSTLVDLTPPQVVSVVPSPGSTVARNAVIEITFNKGVDPTSATGPYTTADPQFSNVTVASGTTRVQGTWEPSNQYQTIGFKTNVLGGTNSCGNPVYVLPGGVTLTVTALAATVGDAPPQAAFYPPDGIVDLAGNSLDGNGDGKAEGPPTDNVTWQFTTTDAMDLTPPKLESVDPSAETGNVDLGLPVTMTFDKPMSITTLTNANLVFDSVPQLPLWYFGGGVNLDANGAPVTSIKDTVVNTQAVINHERLSPTVGVCAAGDRAGDSCAVDTDCPGSNCNQTVFFYYPEADSGVTDIYQNCFLPACGTDPTSGASSARPNCSSTATNDVSCPSEFKINSTSGKLYCDETSSP
jgi:hypothetical protein